uniref:SPRY domain-containing SOCS box protein 3 n=1 Tax=Poecilia reticulata TaxID=8081 RepID=A0A3P9Q167_POERE
MLRRSWSGKTRHVAWSETWQDADVMAAADREEWDSQSVTQVRQQRKTSLVLRSRRIKRALLLLLLFSVFDWVWDERCKSSGASLSCDDRKVSFHSDYSCGTAAIRGNRALSEGQHYWEVKMTSPVYGTDMMVGVGTSEVNLDKFKFSFGSLLGHDEDSWGLSYTGLLQHKGDKVKFSPRFGQGSVIGVHLDTWHGTLTFYKNRHCIGVAATRLQSKKFYPMVCSTAAKSSMKVVCACFAPTSLQYLCCARLRQMLPSCPDVVDALQLPPGLRTVLQSQLDWVFTSVPSSPTCHCPPTPPSSDYDSCCSDPEDYQCKRCRWT